MRHDFKLDNKPFFLNNCDLSDKREKYEDTVNRVITFSMAQQPLEGQGVLIIAASRSYSDTPQSVGLPWMSDQPDADTPTWQHTALTTDKHPCPRRDWNPQSQTSSSSRPTSETARPVESAITG